MNLNSIVSATGLVAPILAVIIFALPAFISILRQRGFVRGLLIISILGLFFLGAITAAVKTGLPYGRFEFGSTLGYKLFGATPWIISFIYTVVLLVGFWLASKFTTRGGRVILTALFMALADVVFNPAVAKLELWKWQSAGPFYGVPVFSFLGSFIVALLAAWLLHLLWGKGHEVRAGVALSGLALLLFWTGANAGINQWVPFGVGVLEAAILLFIVIAEKKSLKSKHA